MKKIERQFCQWHETMETRAECSMKPTTEKWTHTKTPWKVADQKEYIYAYNRTSVAKTLTIDCPFMEAAANAAYIVRAVNAHEELVAAIKAVQEGFRDGSIKWAKPRQSDSDPYHKANTLMCEAIAKAEGRI